MHTVAVVGKSGSDLAGILESCDLGKIEIFDFAREREKLMEPNQEGYRQVINYFGEEFLYKDGWLNLNKLWKFIYGDFHKLRIFEFLMEPLLVNELHKREKSSGRRGFLVFLPGLVDQNLYEKFGNVFWLDLSQEQLLKNLRVGDWPAAAEKLWDAEARLFLKPKSHIIVCKSQEELREEVEKWLRFV